MLMQLIEEGVLNELRMKWMPRKNPDGPCSTDRKVEAGWAQVVSLFMLWTAGAACALAVCCLEKCARVKMIRAN